MKNELPGWALPVAIVVAVLVIGGALWAMMGSGPKKVDTSELPPIPAPAGPPPVN